MEHNTGCRETTRHSSLCHILRSLHWLKITELIKYNLLSKSENVCAKTRIHFIQIQCRLWHGAFSWAPCRDFVKNV